MEWYTTAAVWKPSGPDKSLEFLFYSIPLWKTEYKMFTKKLKNTLITAE